MSKDIKRFRKKKPKTFLTISLGILLLMLSFSLYVYLKPKPNDDIFFLNTNNEAILGNKNPSFNVNFGKRDEPDTQWVRFEAKSSSKNPFKEENENIFTKISNLVKPKKEYGIEMSLEGVKLGETEKLEVADSNEVVKSVAEIIGTDDISTSTELVESGRVIGEYTEDPVSKKTVLNKEVADGVDIEYQILEGLGLKEEIVIRDMEEYTKDCGEDLSECKLPLNEFVFDIKLDEGLKLKSNWVTIKGKSTENYHFEDEDGNYVAHFLPSWAIDSAGDKTYDVILNVEEKEDGNYRATVIVDINWLFSSDRVYPVRIDPSIVHDSSEDFNLGEVLNRIDILTGPKVQIKENVLEADANTVGLWHLEETGGTGAYLLDSSGNNNHGTPTGTTYTEGKIGGARSFNGSTDYIYTGTISGINAGNTVHTIDAWIKPNAVPTTRQWPLLLGAASAGNHHWTMNADGNIYLGVWGGGQCSITPSIGVWNHIATTFDGTTLKCYKNGMLISSASATFNLSSPALKLAQAQIGEAYFDGSIDEVRISNIARTPEEIQQSYYKQAYRYGTYVSEVLDLGTSSSIDSFDWTETGVGTDDGETPYSTTGLVGQWDFNETSGTTAGNVGSCGAGCDGTLTNFSNTTGQDVVAGSGWTNDNRKWGAGALMFDGTNDNVIAGSESSFDFERTSSFSIESWIKTSYKSGPQVIVSKFDSSAPYNGYELVMDTTGFLSFGIHNSYPTNILIVNTSKTGFNDGNWHHVVMTYAGTSSPSGIHIYVDGIDQSLVTVANSLTSTVLNNISLNIGSRNNTAYFFNGIIDSTKIYSRALSSSEILSNYQSGNIEFQYRTSDDGSTWSDWYGGIEESIEDFNNEYLYDTNDSGLVAYYPMDEDSGTSVEDVTTNTNDGTASGTVIVDGKHGNSRGFDGTDDYVDIPYFSPPSEFTLNVWINFSGIIGTEDQNDILSWGDTVNSPGHVNVVRLDETDGKVYVVYGEYDGTWTPLTGNQEISTGDWHLITVTKNSSDDIQIYVNGVPDIEGSISRSPTTNTLSIGATRHSTLENFFHGSIDTVSIYSRALSSTEIHNKWLEGSTNPSIVRTESISNSMEGNNALSIESNGSSIDGNTVGYWKLDESSGTGAYLKDSSPNGNDGTPTGTSSVEAKIRNGRSFPGSTTTDYIEKSSFSNFPTNEITTEFWIKTSSTNSDGVISYASSGSDNDWLIYNTSNITPYCVGGILSSGVSVNDGLWHHVAVTWQSSGGVVRVYKDGELKYTGILSSGSSITTGGTLIFGQEQDSIGGGFDSNQAFGGILDEVHISNVVRTSEEIYDSYILGKDKYISKSINTVDLSSNTTLPFWIASDQIGNNIDMTYGESAYANYEPDENTVGLWHLDENYQHDLGYTSQAVDSSGNSNSGEILITHNDNFDSSNSSFFTYSSLGTYQVVPYSLSGENVIRMTSDGSTWHNFNQTDYTITDGEEVIFDFQRTANSNWHMGALEANDGTYYRWCIQEDGVGGIRVQMNTGSGYTNPQTLIGSASTGTWYTALLRVDDTNGMYMAVWEKGDPSTIQSYQNNTMPTGKSWRFNSWQINTVAGYIDNFKIRRTNADETFSSGKIGDARSFNGSSDYIQSPDNNAMNFTTEDFTVETWVKSDMVQDSTWPGLISKESGSTRQGYNMFLFASTSYAGPYFEIYSNGTGAGVGSSTSIRDNGWHNVVAVKTSSTLELYVDGKLVSKANHSLGSVSQTTAPFTVGKFYRNNVYSKATLDEVRISNIARTPDEIRQAYEVGLRTHSVQIDFGASLVSGNLITGSGDTSFSIDATVYGLDALGSGIYKDEKIIIKENYNGTEYIAQGDIATINKSTGAVTVSSWDSGSTFPTSGFTTNATVFKWQREYIDVRSPLDEDINQVNRLTFRKTTDVPTTFWIDDIKKATYMEDGNIGNTEEQVLGFNDDTTNRDSILKMEGDRSLSLSNTEVYSKNTFTSNDITGYDKLPFWIASDQKGYHSSLLLDGSTDYANYIPDANTVGYWKMDEESGTGAYIEDFSSNSNDGTPSGTTFVKDGKIGGARGFPGASTDHRVTKSSFSNFPTNEITTEFWAKSTGTNDGIISYASSSSDNDWLIFNSSNLSIYRGTSISTGVAINDGMWTHIVITWESSSGSVKLYKNGVLKFSGTLSAGSSITTGGTLILGQEQDSVGGGLDSNQAYAGILDEVRISNVARSASEIYESYNIGKRMLQPEIKFKADLQSSNLITDSSDKSFDISETAYDTTNDIENLESGDKIIITEDTYKAQGTVDTVNTSTGAVTVSTWDSGSTFPLGGYTTSANVFKWQKEYLYTSQVDEEYLTSLDQITMITSGQANIWYDDIRAGEELAYLDSSQYFQYRAVFTTTDEDITPWLSQVNIDYTPGPTMDQIMRHGKWFGSGQKQNFWWARTE